MKIRNFSIDFKVKIPSIRMPKFSTNFDVKIPNFANNGHVNTIMPVYLTTYLKLRYVRERFDTPDNDFIDCDWVNEKVTDKPTVVLFHGTEGNSKSHYAKRLMYYLKSIGWRGVVVHFRGCSEEMNKKLKFYHAGDTSDMNWILGKIKARTSNNLFAIGVSLGGNMLLKYLGENPNNNLIDSAIAISVPFKLGLCVDELDNKLFNRYIYTKHFLSSLLPKIKEKANLFDEITAPSQKIDSLKEFNDLYICQVYGFKNVDDYHEKSSCISYLKDIATPTMILQAENDPMIPTASWPDKSQLSKSVRFISTKTGGHAGFATITRNFKDGLLKLPKFLVEYLNSSISRYDTLDKNVPELNLNQELDVD